MFQEEKLKRLQHKYAVVFENWRHKARLSRVMLKEEASDSELSELINKVNITCKNVQTIYEQIRQIETSDAEIRCKVDACAHLFTFIVERAERQLKGDILKGDEEP